jgi:hypothetical protein
MAKEKETFGKKPISLAEARKRMSEHTVSARIQGNKQGLSAAEREGKKSRKGGH